MLTLFERIAADQLPYYLQLMKHLAAAGIPVPDPQPAPTASCGSRWPASPPRC